MSEAPSLSAELISAAEAAAGLPSESHHNSEEAPADHNPSAEEANADPDQDEEEEMHEGDDEEEEEDASGGDSMLGGDSGVRYGLEVGNSNEDGEEDEDNFEDDQSPAEMRPEDDDEDDDVSEGEQVGMEEEAKEDSMQVEGTKGDSPMDENRQQSETAASYSTRGRTVDPNDALERLAREALGDLKEKEPTAFRESFLSDAITEEERRTRTRYIPAVEGMHSLRKHEVKSDIALARTSFSSTGIASNVAASKAKAKRGTTTDLDGDEEMTSADDDRVSSDILRMGTKTVEIGNLDLSVPSTAFVAPPPPKKPLKPSPREVDSVAAFNPPRPPESVGAKKKHRMLRWERRPADIEVDLNNYRKTVQRTRDELTSAVAEREKLESSDNLIRRNLLTHIQELRDEWDLLNKELSAVQQECVNAADLLTSRTRSRGSGKGYAMKDVISVLRSRGQEVEARGLYSKLTPQNVTNRSGIGGLGIVSLKDWNRSTIITPCSPASSWIVPGDTVETPIGKGIAVAVYPPTETEAEELPPKDGDEEMDKVTKSIREYDQGFEDPGAIRSASPLAKVVLGPRVAVRFGFGVGYSPLESVVSKSDPSSYNDKQLAVRWKGLVDTAMTMGSVLDIEAMADASLVDTVDETMLAVDNEDVDSKNANKRKKTRMLPVGADLFPWVYGRGVSFYDLSLAELDRYVDGALFQGSGVLGKRDNQGVTKEIRRLEDEHQRYLELKAKSLQLKNQLYRQRRVRILNERTHVATQERAVRVEALVAEMRTDLKALKRRLDEETTHLGISESEAEGILTAYYSSLDSKHCGDASPPKRARRLSRMEAEGDDMDDEDDAADDQMDVGSTGVAASEM